MASISWNVREKHYDFIPDDDFESITAKVNGESVVLCNCPYCGKFHDKTEVSDNEGDLYGLSIFCCDDCRNDYLDDLGKFCKYCGCWLNKGEGHDYDGYEEYCADCACEKKAEHDDWEAEKAHLRKCML